MCTSKHDVKDSFHRLFLRPEDSLRLSILPPSHQGKPQLIGIPMACTVDCVQSPPTFCTVSETVCDLANDAMRLQGRQAKPHQLDATSEALDDCDRSMTPQAREAENAEADLALSTVPCLSRDTNVAPAPNNSGPNSRTNGDAVRGTDNNKQQQDNKVAPQSNVPMTRPLVLDDAPVHVWG